MYENLREKLSSKYFSIEEYFNEAYSLLKYFMKKEKKMAMIYLILYSTTILTNLFSRNNNIIISQLLNILSLGISTIYSYYVVIFINKIIEKIENKLNKKIFSLIIRQIILGVILFIILIPVVIIIYIGGIIFLWAFVAGETIPKGYIIAFIVVSSLIIILLVSIYILKFQYVSFTYLYRDLELFDSIKYGMHLSKGNVLKILVPNLILLLVSTFLYLPILFPVLFMGISPIFYYSSTILLLVIGLGLNLLSTFLYIIIYLNVQYMDLKKSNNNYDKNEENFIENKKLDKIEENKINDILKDVNKIEDKINNILEDVNKKENKLEDVLNEINREEN